MGEWNKNVGMFILNYRTSLQKKLHRLLKTTKILNAGDVRRISKEEMSSWPTTQQSTPASLSAGIGLKTNAEETSVGTDIVISK